MPEYEIIMYDDIIVGLWSSTRFYDNFTI